MIIIIILSILFVLASAVWCGANIYWLGFRQYGGAPEWVDKLGAVWLSCFLLSIVILVIYALIQIPL